MHYALTIMHYQRGVGFIENVIEQKSFDFAVRMVKLYQYLTAEKREFVLSKQLLRCGTSIGANVSEAQHGQSKPDFYAKMHIALKEANETSYWLRLLHETGYLSQKEFDSVEPEITEIVKILISICKSAKLNNA